eukprot:CAMPEP_0113502986 /NCGR_PEP_ID=MMETSP0014_2-20120614/33885_1 /TAXON_ID=2857 /ORGANISM="Nitzschia sp." /LENGTH=402 /DNA_ID=CAMNT_0000397887 /DNA_START=194 /DNA_END=1399 /DNA_ORIENTATION=+ /assembly_acc=CAM_ASM_000159
MTKLFSLLLAAMATSSTAFVVPTPSSSVTVQPQHQSSSSLTRPQSQLWMSTATEKKQPGTAEMDTEWENLGFEFRPTNSHVKIMYKDGEWSKPELVKDPYVTLHIGATSLHYGQACFEGLKVFHQKDGEVYAFRPEENAARMQSSCRRIMMPELPTELFVQAVEEAVKDNVEYVPPYGSGGALYVRPLLFGSGPRIGLQPADEYTFLVMVIPVGDYYKGGLSAPVDAVIIKDYDRAAPQGVGAVKVAGNYAADLLPNMLSKKKGYPISLYLDAKTQTTIEEFSTSNFVGINKEKKLYVTPSSRSVLPSTTNRALMELAEDEGYTIEQRDVAIEELETFDEVMAVGTAVVVTPVGSVTILDESGEKPEKVYEFGGHEIGPTTQKLYDRVRAIQNGEADDLHNW